MLPEHDWHSLAYVACAFLDVEMVKGLLDAAQREATIQLLDTMGLLCS
jgi:hypothetical protein